MARKKSVPPKTREAYAAELAEIEAYAKKAGCDTSFLYRTTLDRLIEQLDLLDSAWADIEKRGMTVTKLTPRGTEVEAQNPSVQTYNQTSSAANSTVQTLLRIVSTKFMAPPAAGEPEDEL